MYSKDKYRADGLSCACKECRNKENIEYKKKGGLKKLINQDQKPWFKCSSCIAAIGLGHKKAAKILVHLSPGQIYGAWKRGGVSVQTPACGSWKIYASRAAKGRNPNINRTNADIAYEKARMDDIRMACKRGFTWAYIWTKERASRHTSAKYHAMSPGEKEVHNKRCAKRQKEKLANDPEAKTASLEYQKKWRKRNRDKCNEYYRRWARENPERQRELNRISRQRRMDNDPSFRLQQNMRKRYRDIMKTTKNGGSTSYNKHLGCSTKEFNLHLESQFERWMTWDNYGEWHLDHIQPCSSFDHTDEAQIKVCWHWTNLQPLEANENIKKSDTITEPQMNLLFDYA